MKAKNAGKSGSAPPLVTGRVIIPATMPAFDGATAHITLEDVSYADAPSNVVAETITANVRHRPPGSAKPGGQGDDGGDTVLDFTLHALPGSPPIDPHNDYSVRVW